MKLRVTLTLATLFVTAAPAPAATLTHAIVIVRNIETGRQSFKAAGFRVEPARPLEGGLVHAVVPFADGTFLELIAAPVRTAYSAEVYDLTRYRDATTAAGFEVADVYRERARLIAEGFRVDPISVSPHWWDLDFSEPAGVLEPFFLYQYHDLPAGMARRYAPFTHHPNGATSLRGLDVAAEPGSHAASIYAKVGLNHVSATELGAGDPRIVLVRVATSDRMRKGQTIQVDGCRIRFE
jgi:hypothetical protein